MTAFLQSGDGDIDITDGRMSLVSGDEEKRQKIENRLQLGKGEWFLDTRAGTPWLQSILGQKNPDLAVVGRVLRSVIVSVEGIVDAIVSLDPLGSDRVLTGTWIAISDEGTEITGDIGIPFIVPEPNGQVQ